MASRKIQYYILIYGLCFISALICTNADDYIKGRIIGGKPAARNQFPFVTTLCRPLRVAPEEEYIFMKCVHICGATIIDKSWLLTAAHCFYFFQTHLYILAGILKPHEEHKDLQIRKVIRIIPKNKILGSNKMPHDIALVKVDEPFKFNKAVNKIKLPKSYLSHANNSYTIGYGSIQPKLSKYAVSHLRYYHTPVISLKKCQDIIKKNPIATEIRITISQICTSPSVNQSICMGDDGGPLVYENSIVGIIAYTIENCLAPQYQKIPNVYTRVSSYLNFIRNTMNKYK